MDVNTAFVNSDLDRDNVFFNLPDGYAVHDDAGNDISSEYVLHGKRALYGLPQAPRLWNNRLTEWLLAQGFVQCNKDKCVPARSADAFQYLCVWWNEAMRLVL